MGVRENSCNFLGLLGATNVFFIDAFHTHFVERFRFFCFTALLSPPVIVIENRSADQEYQPPHVTRVDVIRKRNSALPLP